MSVDQHFSNCVDKFISNLSLLPKKTLEFSGELLLLVGIEVGVDVEGGFDFFVTEALTDQKGSHVHFDKKRGVGVTQVMNADPLHTGGAAGDLHSVRKTVRGKGEDA